jgi:DUF438 domain-containing protein
MIRSKIIIFYEVDFTLGATFFASGHIESLKMKIIFPLCDGTYLKKKKTVKYFKPKDIHKIY